MVKLDEDSKEEINVQKENVKKVKKTLTICNIPIIRLLTYFVIYSVIGYIIEMLFALITKGVLESRKSFLYGPFCAIYGLGAMVMISGLQKFKKNNYTLFIGGVVIGSIVEYLVSWIGEMIFHVKWWDYSAVPFNINGRICLRFSILWGLLAIYLMSYFNPKIDKLLDKIPKKALRNITIILVVFMFLDWIISSFAVKMFYARLTVEKQIEIQESATGLKSYINLYKENETVNKLVNKLFSDKTIIKNFPNLKITNNNGEVILVHKYFPEIEPYYFKIFTPKF